MSRWSFSSHSRLKLLTSLPAVSRAPDGEEHPKRKALQAHSIAGLTGSRSGSRATAAITAQAERVSCHCSFFLCPPSFLLLSSASSFTFLLLLSLVLPVSCKNGQQPDYKTRMQHNTLLLTGSSTEQSRARASARQVTRARQERARRGRDSDEEDDAVLTSEEEEKPKKKKAVKKKAKVKVCTLVAFVATRRSNSR